MSDAPPAAPESSWDKVHSLILWCIGAPTFFLMSAVVWVATFLRPPRELQRVMGFCCSMIYKSVGFKFRFAGLENIPRGRPCVWVANHVNNFDPMALLYISPDYIIALETDKHFKWPIYGRMVQRWGNLPISKGNSDTTKQSLDLAVQRLKEGVNLMVFPEGTRSRTGTLGRFRRGAFVVAVRAGAPILPVAFRGAYEVWGRGMVLHPGEVVVEFLPVIETASYGDDRAEELCRTTRARIAESLGLQA
jgi:1-acyl-sn-glycerol-3-phosphate acyltransferase